MNDVLKSKMLLTVVVLAGITLFFGVTNKYFINKIADRVIEKLQKDYSPSPYGSGIDPDKIDVVDMAAILVDFQPRPFNKFRREIDPENQKLILKI